MTVTKNYASGRIPKVARDLYRELNRMPAYRGRMSRDGVQSYVQRMFDRMRDTFVVFGAARTEPYPNDQEIDRILDSVCKKAMEVHQKVFREVRIN